MRETLAHAGDWSSLTRAGELGIRHGSAADPPPRPEHRAAHQEFRRADPRPLAQRDGSPIPLESRPFFMPPQARRNHPPQRLSRALYGSRRALR